LCIVCATATTASRRDNRADVRSRTVGIPRTSIPTSTDIYCVSASRKIDRRRASESDERTSTTTTVTSTRSCTTATTDQQHIKQTSLRNNKVVIR
jgi:hypothetical protein